MGSHNRPGSVVLIFIEIEKKWHKEHPLNLMAALLTRSRFSHVEMSIGEESGSHGEMCNVLRVFNDNVGVEVAQRTGRSPMFHYVQVGCSQASEVKMLRFAMQQRGKPFSSVAMARSIVWPRKSDMSSYFCAELVAATLKVGCLLPTNYNPGAATPASLYTFFIKNGATTGNPCTLRNMQSGPGGVQATASSLRYSGIPDRLNACSPDEIEPLLLRNDKRFGRAARPIPAVTSGLQLAPLAQTMNLPPARVYGQPTLSCQPQAPLPFTTPMYANGRASTSAAHSFSQAEHAIRSAVRRARSSTPPAQCQGAAQGNSQVVIGSSGFPLYSPAQMHFHAR